MADTALSPYNDAPVDRSVRVADCTLRDGEQQAGLVVSKDRKVKIARMLDEAGVYEIEAGSPAVSEEDRDAVAEIVDLVDAKVSALAIAREDAVDQVAATGAWGVRISLPAGVLQLQHKLGMTEDQYLDQALRITSHAKAKGLYVVFSPFDTVRADEGFLRRTLGALARAGTADRIRVVDTAGSATPGAVSKVVALVGEATSGIPVEIHVHDDFGLATMNTVAGVLAGAEYVSTSMNSLGERSGNAATEQVCAALELLYGVTTGVDLTRLTALSRAVSAFTGVPLPPNTPVVGENSFTHESGLVTAGVLKEPFTAEAYAPSLVGQRRRLVHGKKSGAAAVRAWLDEHALPSDEPVSRALLDAVKARAVFLERALSEQELAALASAVLASRDG